MRYPYTQFGHQSTFEKSERSTASVALTIKSNQSFKRFKVNQVDWSPRSALQNFKVLNVSKLTKSTGHPGRSCKIPYSSTFEKSERSTASVALTIKSETASVALKNFKVLKRFEVTPHKPSRLAAPVGLAKPHTVVQSERPTALMFKIHQTLTKYIRAIRATNRPDRPEINQPPHSPKIPRNQVDWSPRSAPQHPTTTVSDQSNRLH